MNIDDCEVQKEMRVSNDEEEKICLINWDVVEPFWQKNTFHPLDRSKLLRVYSRLWFPKDGNGETFFAPGRIDFREHDNAIYFINGRHRTNLLLFYNNIVPIACNDSIFNHPILSKAIVVRGAKRIDYKFPELEVWESSDLLAWDRKYNGKL